MMQIVYVLAGFLALTQTIPSSEIDERERELREIRERLVECRNEKRRLETREASLLEKMEALDQELNLTHRMLSELKGKEKRTESEMGATEERRKDTERRLKKKREVFQRRLVTIYKRGKLNPWEILLGTRSFTDGLRRMKYLTLIARQDQRVCDEIISLRARLAEDGRTLASKLDELRTVREEAEAEEKNLGKDKREKRRLLTTIRSKKEEQEKIAKELREAEKRLGKLIEDLERKRREELERLGRPEGVHYFETNKGSLMWPTEGDVVSNFGKRLHPKYPVKTWNNGIDIRAPMQAPVIVVGDGVVAYADRFLGYGEIALIDHGAGFYTLYAHLSQTLVKVGDEVKQGDLIARVGETGSLEGPVLHFELRVDGRPVDPLPWLRKR